MKKGIILAICGLAFLSGCGNQGNNATNVPVTPKWKGLAYRLAFDTKEAKPNPSGITIPDILYTGNPEALETRASLVVRFDPSSAKKVGPESDQPVMDKMMMAPFDIKGETGALPADYMDLADKGLAKMLTAYCMNGKIKASVALARSSLSPGAGDAEVDQKRLSDWLPVDLTFKNPHKGC